MKTKKKLRKIKEELDWHNTRLGIAEKNRCDLWGEFRKFRLYANNKFTDLEKEIKELRASLASDSACNLNGRNETNKSVFDLNRRLQKEIDVLKEGFRSLDEYSDGMHKAVEIINDSLSKRIYDLEKDKETDSDRKHQ